MNERITDLEIRYTHLEQQVQELSEVVFAQQRTIDNLNKQLLELRGRVQEPGEAPPAEKPPHY